MAEASVESPRVEDLAASLESASIATPAADASGSGGDGASSAGGASGASDDSKAEESKSAGAGLSADDHLSTLEVQQADPSTPYYSAKSFEDLGLTPELLRGVYDMGFSKPSKIQERALPMILADPPTNLIAQAHNGSGKTAAFALSMLSRSDSSVAAPQALCICPVRELARQIGEVVDVMGKFTGMSSFLAIPGCDQRSVVRNQIVIGTPGKVKDLIKRKKLRLGGMRIFVLDEADQMVGEKNFRDAVTNIKDALPDSAQMLLFSATYSDDVKRWAVEFVDGVDKTNLIVLRKEELSLDSIKQFFIRVDGEADKRTRLLELYAYLEVGQSVVFVNRRATGVSLTEFLRSKGHTVSLLTGYGKTMTKDKRDQIMDEFRNGTTKVLVATNVLARGIDVLGVSLVINYDIPVTYGTSVADPETYIHRIGRTGRFGRKGSAINFVHDRATLEQLKAIEEHFRKEIKEIPVEDIADLDELLFTHS